MANYNYNNTISQHPTNNNLFISTPFMIFNDNDIQHGIVTYLEMVKLGSFDYFGVDLTSFHFSQKHWDDKTNAINTWKDYFDAVNEHLQIFDRKLRYLEALAKPEIIVIEYEGPVSGRPGYYRLGAYTIINNIKEPVTVNWTSSNPNQIGITQNTGKYTDFYLTATPGNGKFILSPYESTINTSNTPKNNSAAINISWDNIQYTRISTITATSQNNKKATYNASLLQQSQRPSPIQLKISKGGTVVSQPTQSWSSNGYSALYTFSNATAYDKYKIETTNGDVNGEAYVKVVQYNAPNLTVYKYNNATDKFYAEIAHLPQNVNPQIHWHTSDNNVYFERNNNTTRSGSNNDNIIQLLPSVTPDLHYIFTKTAFKITLDNGVKNPQYVNIIVTCENYDIPCTGTIFAETTIDETSYNNNEQYSVQNKKYGPPYIVINGVSVYTNNGYENGNPKDLETYRYEYQVSPDVTTTYEIKDSINNIPIGQVTIQVETIGADPTLELQKSSNNVFISTLNNPPSAQDVNNINFTITNGLQNINNQINYGYNINTTVANQQTQVQNEDKTLIIRSKILKDTNNRQGKYTISPDLKDHAGDDSKFDLFIDIIMHPFYACGTVSASQANLNLNAGPIAFNDMNFIDYTENNNKPTCIISITNYDGTVETFNSSGGIGNTFINLTQFSTSSSDNIINSITYRTNIITREKIVKPANWSKPNGWPSDDVAQIITISVQDNTEDSRDVTSNSWNANWNTNYDCPIITINVNFNGVQVIEKELRLDDNYTSHSITAHFVNKNSLSNNPTLVHWKEPAQSSALKLFYMSNNNEYQEITYTGGYSTNSYDTVYYGLANRINIKWTKDDNNALTTIDNNINNNDIIYVCNDDTIYIGNYIDTDDIPSELIFDSIKAEYTDINNNSFTDEIYVNTNFNYSYFIENVDKFIILNKNIPITEIPHDTQSNDNIKVIHNNKYYLIYSDLNLYYKVNWNELSEASNTDYYRVLPDSLYYTLIYNFPKINNAYYLQLNIQKSRKTISIDIDYNDGLYNNFANVANNANETNGQVSYEYDINNSVLKFKDFILIDGNGDVSTDKDAKFAIYNGSDINHSVYSDKLDISGAWYLGVKENSTINNFDDLINSSDYEYLNAFTMDNSDNSTVKFNNIYIDPSNNTNTYYKPSSINVSNSNDNNLHICKFTIRNTNPLKPSNSSYYMNIYDATVNNGQNEQLINFENIGGERCSYEFDIAFKPDSNIDNYETPYEHFYSKNTNDNEEDGNGVKDVKAFKRHTISFYDTKVKLIDLYDLYDRNNTRVFGNLTLKLFNTNKNITDSLYCYKEITDNDFDNDGKLKFDNRLWCALFKYYLTDNSNITTTYGEINLCQDQDQNNTINFKDIYDRNLNNYKNLNYNYFLNWKDNRYEDVYNIKIYEEYSNVNSNSKNIGVVYDSDGIINNDHNTNFSMNLANIAINNMQITNIQYNSIAYMIYIIKPANGKVYIVCQYPWQTNGNDDEPRYGSGYYLLYDTCIDIKCYADAAYTIEIPINNTISNENRHDYRNPNISNIGNTNVKYFELNINNINNYFTTDDKIKDPKDTNGNYLLIAPIYVKVQYDHIKHTSGTSGWEDPQN